MDTEMERSDGAGRSGGALQGMRVLDLTWGPAGAIATMVLADHGAEVLRVDRPGGDPCRRAGAFATWDRGKHSAELDVRVELDLRTVEQLAQQADVVVDGLGAGRLDSLGLGFDALRASNPGLVYCALSACGPEVEDPMLGHDLLAAAKFGVMAETGGHRPGPIFPGHPAASYATGLMAAIGTLACVRARLVSGRGDRVDVSNLDGVLALSTMEWWSERGVSFIRGKLMNNRLDLGRRALLLQHYMCSDGEFLQVNTAAPGAFDRAMEVFGIAGRISVVGQPAGTELTDADLSVLADELPDIVASRPLDHWLGELWAARVAALPILPPGRAFDDEQLQHLGAMSTVEHPERGPIDVVGATIGLSESPAPPLGPIEARGHSTERARTGWRSPGLVPAGPVSAEAPSPTSEAPLSGVRILELSSFFASPYGNRILADLGADVVKIEPPGGDPQRGLPDPAENVNARKRSVIVDLKHELARPVIERLVAWADVVGHNMRPGTIERLGLGADHVRAISPHAVYVYGPGYGSSGPKSGLQSFAPLHSGFVGLMHLAAGDGNDPVVPFGNEDYYTGLLSAVGTLLALIHRERTGLGQYVEVSQLLATTFTVSEFFRRDGGCESTLGDLDAEQTGWSPYLRLYRCADDEWICVSALHDGERHALRDLVQQRMDDDAALSAALATVMVTQPARRWRSTLRQRGIPCEIARSTPWLAEYLLTSEEGSIELDTAEHGRVRVIGNLFRGHCRSDAAGRQRAPRAGEDGHAVLTDLGFDDADIDELVRAGAVAAGPTTSASS